MMDAQVSPNATQVHPIHIQLQGLLAHVFWIASRFGLWRVFALTVHAQIPLGTRFGFSGSVLPRGLLTFRTGLHSSILTQKSIHSPKVEYQRSEKPATKVSKEAGSLTCSTYASKFSPSIE